MNGGISMKGKEKIAGLIIFVILVVALIGTKFVLDKKNTDVASLPEVFGAVGGGKENFLADEEFLNLLHKTYKINPVNDGWSNGKLVKDSVVRKDGSHYDFIFFSDQRFYDYFKLTPDKLKEEAERDKVLKGSLTLNTPIVIYSWDKVVDSLINEQIVTEQDGIYYITDMSKLLVYILEGKTWESIGVNNIYGKINIDSTDPVTSSQGATYYGLLAAIMTGGIATDENMETVLPKLKEFYIKSGYMNNTPADLFEMYLKTGMGSKPMIVDYEKSIIDFANANPDGFDQVKDRIRILYPTPTIWNSHCIATLTEEGNTYLEAFDNKEVQQIAWSKYGFRTGVTGGNYDVSSINISGIPQTIDSVVPALKMNMYDKMIEYLK